MQVLSRKKEILNSFKAFSDEKYHKDEVLSELFKLQDEAVQLTFNDMHAESGSLNLHDVCNHFEQLSLEKLGIVTDEIEELKNASYAIYNLIQAEISGQKGEEKAFRFLKQLKCKKEILKNIELSDGFSRTELDAVVVTSKGVFIIEVKNTAKDIFISEDGSYYRTGKYTRKDCNIKSKMDKKEKLLRRCLMEEGLDYVNIERILVFTNDNIEVVNKCESIKICFLALLPTLIDDYTEDEIYSDGMIKQIAQTIDYSRKSEMYPVDKEIARFKEAFANAMAMAVLEVTEIEVVTEEENAKVTSFTSRKVDAWGMLHKIISSPYAKEVGYAVAELALNFAVKKIIEKRVA